MKTRTYNHGNGEFELHVLRELKDGSLGVTQIEFEKYKITHLPCGMSTTKTITNKQKAFQILRTLDHPKLIAAVNEMAENLIWPDPAIYQIFNTCHEKPIAELREMVASL